MSSNPRDSQFSEWAKLLDEEIQNAILGMSVDEGTPTRSAKLRKDIIARRTYDLVMFIVGQAFEDEIKPKEILYKNGKSVLMYPENLKEWFKEDSSDR